MEQNQVKVLEQMELSRLWGFIKKLLNKGWQDLVAGAITKQLTKEGHDPLDYGKVGLRNFIYQAQNLLGDSCTCNTIIALLWQESRGNLVRAIYGEETLTIVWNGAQVLTIGQLGCLLSVTGEVETVVTDQLGGCFRNLTLDHTVNKGDEVEFNPLKPGEDINYPETSLVD